MPILSFLWLRGRCRFCRRPITRFHLVVELGALAVALLAAAVDRDAAWLWADCGLGWTLLTLAWIDLRHLTLPDVLTLPLLVAGLSVTESLAPRLILGHALGAIIGYAAFRTIALLYHRLRGRHGLGEGDAKLLAAGGAWTGVSALPTIILGAALIGIAATLLLPPARRQSFDTAVPFGPALALVILLVRLFPVASSNGYLSAMPW